MACVILTTSSCAPPKYHNRDAKGMAKGVHDELVNLLIEYGGFEKMAAMMELNKWAQEKRYLRDLVSITFHSEPAFEHNGWHLTDCQFAFSTLCVSPSVGMNTDCSYP